MCFILLVTQVHLELQHLVSNCKTLERFELFCLHCKSTQIGPSTWPTGQFCGIPFTACGCTKRSCTKSALIWSTVRVRLPIVLNFVTCVCLCGCMRIFSGSKMRQSGSEIVLLVAPTCGGEWLRLGECAFVWTGQCVLQSFTLLPIILAVQVLHPPPPPTDPKTAGHQSSQTLRTQCWPYYFFEIAHIHSFQLIPKPSDRSYGVLFEMALPISAPKIEKTLFAMGVTCRKGNILVSVKTIFSAAAF